MLRPWNSTHFLRGDFTELAQTAPKTAPTKKPHICKHLINTVLRALMYCGSDIACQPSFRTRSGNRTRTGITAHRILSPACLPIPPSEHPYASAKIVNFGEIAITERKNVKFKIRERVELPLALIFWGGFSSLLCSGKRVAL